MRWVAENLPPEKLSKIRYSCCSIVCTGGLYGKQGSEQQEELRGSEKRTQQPQANPVAVLLEWSGKKDIRPFGSSPSLVPAVWFLILLPEIWLSVSLMRYEIGRFTCSGLALQQWLCGADYLPSSQRRFHISQRSRPLPTFVSVLHKKLTRIPMGYVLDTRPARLKRLLVEKVDSIETTLAHAVPELTSNIRL